MKPRYEVADIFRAFGPAYRQQYGAHLSPAQWQAMHAIETCRTAALGGHVDQCDHCGAQRIAYNSCRNRHCPKCQALDKEQWLEARQADLLPIPYFHVVFTLPETLRPVALQHQAVVYDLLFQAASQTLMQLTRDPQHLGAEIGCTMLLHTWSQTLNYHPHVHGMVTGGGLSPDGSRWIGSRKDFFLPVKVMSRLFRGKVLAALKQAYQAGHLPFSGALAAWADEKIFRQQLTPLYQQDWIVYCKPPFGRPEQTLAYLARYTHRVALSNDRLLNIEDDHVTFSYREATDRTRIQPMTIPAFEFIRRFLLHVIPHQFRRIRHYGLLSNRSRATKLQQAQQLLGARAPAHRLETTPKPTWQERLHRLTGVDPRRCPCCGQGRWVTQQILLPLADRAPPLRRANRA